MFVHFFSLLFFEAYMVGRKNIKSRGYKMHALSGRFTKPQPPLLLYFSPGGAPDGGKDPLRLHLHGLDVLHLGHGGLGQLPLGSDGVADLPVQELSLVRVRGQVIQEEGGRGTWAKCRYSYFYLTLKLSPVVSIPAVMESMAMMRGMAESLPQDA